MERAGGAAEALVWDNDVSAHAQIVAKAKYEFLFGLEEEKPSEVGCFLRTLILSNCKLSGMALLIKEDLLPAREGQDFTAGMCINSFSLDFRKFGLPLGKS